MLHTMGKDIKGKMVIDYSKNTLKLTLIPESDQAKVLVSTVLEQISGVLSEVAQNQFGIMGEIVERNKPSSDVMSS